MEFLPLHNQGDEWAGLQLPQWVSDAITSLCFLFCCLLVWALFSLWWDRWPWATPGSSKSGTRMKGAEQWLVQLRSHAHQWIDHDGQKKVALLLVYLMWPWEPQRLSKEHTWLVAYAKRWFSQKRGTTVISWGRGAVETPKSQLDANHRTQPPLSNCLCSQACLPILGAPSCHKGNGSEKKKLVSG